MIFSNNFLILTNFTIFSINFASYIFVLINSCSKKTLYIFTECLDTDVISNFYYSHLKYFIEIPVHSMATVPITITGNFILSTGSPRKVAFIN